MSSLVTRVIRIGSKRTSIRLTPIEVEAMKLICESKSLTTSRFCAIADESFSHCRVRTQRIRMAILQHYMGNEGSSTMKEESQHQQNH